MFSDRVDSAEERYSFPPKVILNKAANLCQFVIRKHLDNVVLDDFSPWRSVLIQRLKSKGVKIITRAKVTQILPNGVKYRKDSADESLRGMNHIVLAMGTRSNNALVEKLQGSPIPIYVIGDAKEPHTALEAIAEAWKVGRKI